MSNAFKVFVTLVCIFIVLSGITGCIKSVAHLESDRQAFLAKKFNTEDVRIAYNRDSTTVFLVKEPTNNFIWQVEFDFLSRDRATYKKIF